MPTYDYECTACGHTFELFQPISDKPIKKCPECEKPKAKRLIGGGYFKTKWVPGNLRGKDIRTPMTKK